MAKKSAVNRNLRVKALTKQFAAKRAALKATANNESLPLEERFEARLKLAELPRNSSPTRFRNRCEVTGRPRGNYRKFKLCRNMLRELANSGQIPGHPSQYLAVILRDLGSNGLIPGLVKSSW